MNYSEYNHRLRTKFYAELQRKTNFGRNELKAIFDKVLTFAITDELDEQLIKQKAFHLLQQKKDNTND